MNARENKNLSFFKRRSCTEKVKYKTWYDAIRRLFIYREEKEVMVDSVYRCPFCKNLHLGHHKNKSKTKKMYKLLNLKLAEDNND